MTTLVEAKLSAIIKKNALEFTWENFNKLIERNYELAILFAKNNLKILCEELESNQAKIDLAMCENLLETKGLTLKECQVIINSSKERVSIWPDFNDNANIILIDRRLSESEVSRLPQVWNNAETDLKDKIIEKYQELAAFDADLGVNVPYLPLAAIIANQEISSEKRKLLLASNIHHLSKQEVADCLGKVGLNYFKGVVVGTYKRKMTKTSFPDANKEIAISLKGAGLISSWGSDWRNPNHIWVYGLSSQIA